MAITPERNDVNITSLFHWGDQFEIDGYGDEKLKVYIRLVGDSDSNRARVMGLRRSAELRKKLKDLNSDERIAYIAEEGSIDRNNLIAYIQLVDGKDFYRDVSTEVNIPFPSELKSDATLEQQEKYQKEVDDYPEKLKEEVNRLVSKKMDAFKIILDAKSDEELYKMYVERAINELCETEMYSKYTECMVSNAVFVDEDYKIKMFNSFEEFENLPHNAKVQLNQAYKSLELTLDELKK